MLKQVNFSIVFQEVPDEVTLAINISNCPNNCVGCHSEFLKEDIGEPLSVESLKNTLTPYKDTITCVAFMGGDNDPVEVQHLAKWVLSNYNGMIKTAWYSGKSHLPKNFDASAFNYVKVGPYISEFGPLNATTTNQRMYRIEPNGEMTDITFRFWKK